MKEILVVIRRQTFFVVLVLMLTAAAFAADVSGVKVWETKAVIPTYLAGDPEPNPMFFFGRESQGAQGPVYPYPMYDSLTGKKVDKTYTIVYLENEYIRIGVLPAARNQAGFDRPDRRVDFRRGGMEHPAPSPRQHLHSGAIQGGGKCRRQQDRLGG
jgi:hypothetical protein